MADADALKDDHVKALTVAIATSPPEAAALTDALESAGIPTHVQDIPDGRAYGMEVSLVGTTHHRKRILVPEDRVLQAEEVVNTFLREAKEKAVRRAFQPEDIEDLAKDPRPEPEMVIARALKDVDEEEREERLCEHIADWLTDAHPEIKIAQRLAAAGLTEAQATSFVARVVRDRAALFERSRRRQMLAGAAMLTGGVVYSAIVVISLLTDVANGASGTRQNLAGPTLWAVMLLGLGILTLTRARFMKNPALETVFATQDESQEEKSS